MLSTLENIRLREGDRVVVSLNSGEYEGQVIDAGDPAKVKVRLMDTGSEVWVGRRAVRIPETQERERRETESRASGGTLIIRAYVFDLLQREFECPFMRSVLE